MALLLDHDDFCLDWVSSRLGCITASGRIGALFCPQHLSYHCTLLFFAYCAAVAERYQPWICSEIASMWMSAKRRRLRSLRRSCVCMTWLLLWLLRASATLSNSNALESMPPKGDIPFTTCFYVLHSSHVLFQIK